MSDYYSPDGEPITFDEYLRVATAENEIVGRDEIGDILVSTIWLGMNHQWGAGPPLIFETMIFGGEHDQWQERYSTRAEAEAGHAAALALVTGEPT